MPETRSSSQSLDEALGAILKLLQRRRTPYMVMGGLALSVWGRVRATQDIDLAIALDDEQEAHFLDDLKRAHFLPATPRTVVGHRLLVCRYLKSTKGLPIEVDLFFARGLYQNRALGRAAEVSLGPRRLRVIAPEDLVLYKLLASRPIDLLDIQAVLEEQRGRLDRRYLKYWAQQLKLTKRLNAALNKLAK